MKHILNMLINTDLYFDFSPSCLSAKSFCWLVRLWKTQDKKWWSFAKYFAVHIDSLFHNIKFENIHPQNASFTKLNDLKLKTSYNNQMPIKLIQLLSEKKTHTLLNIYNEKGKPGKIW